MALSAEALVALQIKQKAKEREIISVCAAIDDRQPRELPQTLDWLNQSRLAYPSCRTPFPFFAGSGKSRILELLLADHRRWVSSHRERVCPRHAWTEALSEEERSQLGDACNLLLTIPLVSECGQKGLLEKALSLLRDHCIKELTSAQKETSAAQTALQSAVDKLASVEGRFLDRQVSIQVSGLAGMLGGVHCDCGSTIFYVKQLIQRQLGVPVEQQVLLYNNHKLENQDLLHWFPPHEHNMVKLTLVVQSEVLGWGGSTYRNEHEEFESAYLDIEAAEEWLEEVQEKQAAVQDGCSKKLKAAFLLPALILHLAWLVVDLFQFLRFQEKLAEWDEEVRSRCSILWVMLQKIIVDNSLHQTIQDHPGCDSSCRFNRLADTYRDLVRGGCFQRPAGRDSTDQQLQQKQEKKPSWAEQQERLERRQRLEQRRDLRTKKQELRFKQQASRSHLKGRDAPLAHLRQRLKR